MRNSLKEQLRKLDDVEFRELKLALQIADNARSIIQDYNLTQDQFTEKMELSYIDDFIRGASSYNLKQLARLEAYRNELEQDRLAKELAKQDSTVPIHV